MNIASLPALQPEIAAAQADTADTANIMVLKKAMDIQASSAMTLLQALPQPALATQGLIGTKVNTFA